MIVSRLRLFGFKRHRELELDLGPGLNIVRGANEAGKSTVQKALEMGLFRRPTFSGAELEELRPWRDTQTDPIVEIEFTHDGRPGRIQKVFAAGKGTVELQVGEDHYNDPAAVESQIATLTGLPSEKFFRASASVHH